MEHPAPHQSLSLQRVRTIEIPPIEKQPGLLHTIVQDTDGSIYYTDEFNDSLVSLDAAARIKWHRGRRGKGSGEFWYPKGLDLGRISTGGRTIRCIAVCDSWNHRIQFFDPDGKTVCQWTTAGKLTLEEVIDIRFLDAGVSSDGCSCWLVLDRAKHRLFGLDLTGELLFQIGRPFIETLKCHWSIPCADLIESGPQARYPGGIPILDPLFMPLRIFGSVPEALFVWGPKTRRLKQVCLGNLIPVWIDPPAGAEWIGADAEGLVAFNNALHIVISYDTADKTWRSGAVEGTPVSCGRSSRELWIQCKNEIHYFACGQRLPRRASESVDPGKWAVGRLVDEVEHCFDGAIAARRTADLELVTDRICALGTQVTELDSADCSDPKRQKSVTDDLTSLQQEFSAALASMEGFACILFLALLKFQFLRMIYPKIRTDEQYMQAAARLLDSTEPVACLFERLLSLRDECTLAGDLLGRPSYLPSARPSSNLLEGVAASILHPLIALARWSWFVSAIDELVDAAASAGGLPSLDTARNQAWLWIGRPAANRMRPSRLLRQLDRISLAGAGIPSPTCPAALGHLSEKCLLVTLYNSNQIMRLNDQGRILGPLEVDSLPRAPLDGPLGIATDSDGRIWVSESLSHRIKIIDPGTGQIDILEFSPKDSIHLRNPMGIHRAANGSMLIADTCNNRVLSVSNAESPEILCDRIGKNRGELRYPFSFCSSSSNDTFWVVDNRNHRLQEFSLEGTPIRVIGGAGLGLGRLVLPEFAAQFDDGSIVIGQSACIKALKLFSPDGDELDSIQLDYSPRGMLVYQGLLLVCEWAGDHIYVYERT